MLIKATATMVLENVGRAPLTIVANEFADLHLPEALAAIQQGTAVPATLEQAREAHNAESGRRAAAAAGIEGQPYRRGKQKAANKESNETHTPEAEE